MFLRFYANFYFIFFLSIGWLVTGCSTVIHPPQDLNTYKNLKVRKQSTELSNFEAFGKVGFSDGKKGGSATLEWIQQNQNFQVRLYGPLGNGAVQIYGQPGHVILTQSGKNAVAKNPEALVQAQLGLTIPVSGLQFWLRGMPVPGTLVKHLEMDAQQHIWEMQQQGWLISYQVYQFKNGMAFPLKLTLKNGPIRLKFIFQRWKVLPS